MKTYINSTGTNLTNRQVADMPTLSSAHSEDLKYEEEDLRLWISRVSGLMSIESLLNGRWVVTWEQAVAVPPVCHDHWQQEDWIKWIDYGRVYGKAVGHE